MDSNLILRVGGRIQNSDLNYETKHQILLRKQNPLAYLLFKDAHLKKLHLVKINGIWNAAVGLFNTLKI